MPSGVRVQAPGAGQDRPGAGPGAPPRPAASPPTTVRATRAPSAGPGAPREGLGLPSPYLRLRSRPYRAAGPRAPPHTWPRDYRPQAPPRRDSDGSGGEGFREVWGGEAPGPGLAEGERRWRPVEGGGRSEGTGGDRGGAGGAPLSPGVVARGGPGPAPCPRGGMGGAGLRRGEGGGGASGGLLAASPSVFGSCLL